MKFLFPFLFLFISFSVLAEQFDSLIANNTASINPAEEIIIIGRRPGPPLWRLENGDNTLWVFALVSPIPKSFEWDSSGIEHIIADSQQYFPLPNLKLNASILNPIKLVGMLRRYNKLKKLPNNESLETYLPADEYNKFQVLMERYAPNSKKLIRLRPLFAAEELYKKARNEYGLIGPDKIASAINKLAKRNKLTITKIKVREEIESKSFFESIESISKSDHISCLSSAMNDLDNEIDSLINDALLWADGDPKALIENSQPRAFESCFEYFKSNDQIRRIISQSETQWLNETQQALERNRSSFAVLELHDVIKPDGLLSKLAARGYKLVGPTRSTITNTVNTNDD